MRFFCCFLTVLVTASIGCGSVAVDPAIKRVSDLRSSSAETRLRAARYFQAQKYVPEAAVAPLVGLLSDADADLRLAAALALAEYDPLLPGQNEHQTAIAIAELIKQLHELKSREMDPGVRTALEQAVYHLQNPHPEPSLLHESDQSLNPSG